MNSMHDKTHLIIILIDNKIINNLKFFKVYKIVLSRNYKNIILYDNDTAVNNLTDNST